MPTDKYPMLRRNRCRSVYTPELCHTIDIFLFPTPTHCLNLLLASSFVQHTSLALLQELIDPISTIHRNFQLCILTFCDAPTARLYHMEDRDSSKHPKHNATCCSSYSPRMPRFARKHESLVNLPSLLTKIQISLQSISYYCRCSRTGRCFSNTTSTTPLASPIHPLAPMTDLG